MGEPKPQFFQVFSSNSTTDLLIPNKFYTHLPNELPKFATLIGPSSKFWKVKINRKGQNIYFRKGWTEFQSGNYLCSEDLLIFQYDGNLVFTVTIFDKTSRYLKKRPSEQQAPHNECIIIEDSSEAKIGEKEATSDSDSTEDYKRNSTKKPVQDRIDISDSSDSLDIGDSSDIEDSYEIVDSSESDSESEFDSDTSDETFNEDKEEDEEEISSDFIDKRRKLATDKAQIKVAKKSANSQKTAQKKKSARFNSHVTNQTLDDNSEGESATEVRINSHKKRRKCPQFEKIIRPSMLKLNQTRVPPEFCKRTGWTTSRRIFLEGKHGMKWPVHFHFKSYGTHFRKGWIDFAKENGLKDGDKCVFILISEDTLFVEKISSGHVSATSSLAVPKRLKSKDFASSMYFERTLEECYLREILVPKKFWMRNRFTKNKTIFLKRKMDGRPWKVNFIIVNGCGRISAGWFNFIKEHGFKVADKCSFRFLYKNTILVDLVPESTRKIEENISETIRLVKENHFKSHMYLVKSFCEKNKLMTACEMTLQNSNGKEWHVNYSYNSSGGRLCRKGWRIFLAENELKPGDECVFTYISRDTLLVSIQISKVRPLQ